MNWLSHIFLSVNDIDYQLGNILADPMKGKWWDNAPLPVRDGFAMHLLLDRFTDENLFVLQSKGRLGGKGLLKGVVIDIVYDHFLLHNWSLFSRIDRASFMDSFYSNALQTIKGYPQMPQKFVRNVVKSNGLVSPLTYNGLENVLNRIDKRLARRVTVKEKAVSYLPFIIKERDLLEDDFINFFPQVVNYFKKQSGVELKEHWLR